MSLIPGIVVGIVISLFLKSLQYATNIRENNGWMLYLLPFGGALVSYLFSGKSGIYKSQKNITTEFD